MSRVDLATAAARAVALWLLVRGTAAGAGIVLVQLPAGSRLVYEQPLGRLVLIMSALPLIGGALMWTYARSAATAVFQDKPPEGAATVTDLYRIASAFAGLFILGESLPRLALLLSTWVFSFNAGRSVVGAVGLTAAERTILFDVQMKAAAVSTLVQVACGVVLLAAPARIEKALTGLRREPADLDFETDEDTSDDG
jgi:hypothetical protein